MNARMALLVLGVALGGTVTMVECQELDRDGALKLNQIQVIGTHNSYHAGIPPSESHLWRVRARPTRAGAWAEWTITLI